MTKTLGVKVEDPLYDLFADLPGTISMNLRRAIIRYLNHCHNVDVNHVNSVENRRKHEMICIYLDQLEIDSKRMNGGF